MVCHCGQRPKKIEACDKSAFKQIGLRPVSSDEMKALVLEKLKDQGKISLEILADDYDDAATPVTIDEVSMGNVLTGARQMVTCIHSIDRKGYKTGLVSMCIGGGGAMIVEQ